MSIGRLTLAGLATLCVSGGALAFSSVPALAGTGYRFEHSFGGSGSGEGQFEGAAGVAVNQTSEDVYVVDRGNNRVQRFDAKGKYLGQFNGSGEAPAPLSSPGAIAVDNACSLHNPVLTESTTPTCEEFDPSDGDVYVVDIEDKVIDKFSATGAYINQLTEASSGEPFGELNGGVAVDSNGAVWVYQRSGEIDSFSNALANTFVSELTWKESSEAGGLAVDSHDNLYVTTGRERVEKLNSSGEPLISEVDSEATLGVAVDLSTDNVFLDNEETVGVFNEAGSLIVRFTLGEQEPHAGTGIGIDSATGTVYVAEEGKVDIFSPGPTPPPPKTDPVSDLTATSATLNGELDPEGATGGVGFYFSYSLGASCTKLGSLTTPLGNATGSVDVPESASVTGLQPNAAYAACFFAASEFGATPGLTETFTTEPAKPSIDRQSTSNVTLTGAELNAQINPNNQPLTSCKVEYGETNTYGHELPCEPPSLEGYGEMPVSAKIVGALVSAETYHYRVVAANATGATDGPDQTFMTLPFPPTVTLGEATAGTDTATVAFTANAQGGDTQYAVRYGTSTAYTAQAQGDAGHSRSAVPITATLSELAPGTTYHFSVKVQNAGGEETGPDQTFTTPEAPSPPAKEPTTTEEPPATVSLILVQPPTAPLIAVPAVAFPTETGTVTPPKQLTRAQKLAKALKACKKDKSKSKRTACEKQARKKYGQVKKKK
jgi:hypothetical protein